MPPQIELFCIGFAAVVDTVLLLVVLERINRPLTAIWLKWALTGVTLWHVGSFLHETLRDTTGAMATRLDALCMIAMTCGLLLLTSGILHAGLRIHRTGFVAHPPCDRRYAGIYVPLLFLIAVGAAIFRDGGRDFVVATKNYHLPYLAWVTFSNLTAGWLFLSSRDRFGPVSRSLKRFLLRFSLGLLIVTVLTLTYVGTAETSKFEPQLRLLTTLSPLAPTLVFAYYIFRRRLLPMVFERTLVYGAILLAVFYLHRLTLTPLMRKYSQEFHFDFVVIEGLLLIALILAYQPLRDRFREGLRYLIGADVTKVRDATRQLSVELSRRGSDDAERISEWFSEGLTKALQLRYCLLELHSKPVSRRFLHHSPYEATSDIADLLSDVNLERAFEAFNHLPAPWVDRSRCRNPEQLSVMRELDLIAIFRIHYHDIEGLLLLGALSSGDRLSEEQLNTIALLTDQFSATIHNRHLDEARQAAERRAVQQEKLSTLGLLSGSLAHELKNPLSSMRTVATLLKEDLDGSDNAKDAELIVQEIDRLTQTTQRLLDFAKPADSKTIGVSADHVIERIMHILSYLARQHRVNVVLNLQSGETRVRAADAALSEILFNLIKNAIEAVRETERPTITIETSNKPDSSNESRVIISISDNGPGVATALQDCLFEPFVTGKTDGTGLGLYLVAERVKELHGTIQCTSDSEGTTFSIALPADENEQESRSNAFA